MATQLDPAITQLSASVATARPLDAAAYRSAVLSRPLLLAATDELVAAGHTDLDLTDLGQHLTVTTTEARLSLQIAISVRSTNAVWAALMANAIAEALVRWDTERATDAIAHVTQALDRQIADVDAQIETCASNGDDTMVTALQGVRAEAERNLAATRLALTTISGNLEVLEPAIVEALPEPNRSMLVGLLAAVVTGFGLLVLALLREAVSDKLGGLDGVAALTRQPILGSFPTDSSGSRRLPPEAAGYVRSNLQFLVPPDQPLIVLVASGLAGEGKTSVAIALAEAYARSEYRTAIVDADGRRPRLTSILRADGPGTRAWQEHGEPDAEAGVSIALGRHRSVDVFGLTQPLNGEECRLLGRAFGHLAERLKDRYGHRGRLSADPSSRRHLGPRAASVRGRPRRQPPRGDVTRFATRSRCSSASGPTWWAS
ncbi:MAG: hypothetical protein P1P87_10620 [Trueperaceae bacterium]|nr:hypothetical protein [Trueperaceae bacterium]